MTTDSLKSMVKEAVYKTFETLNPSMIKTIEEAKASGIPERVAKEMVLKAAKKHGSKDNGNGLFLLVDYIYNKK